MGYSLLLVLTFVLIVSSCRKNQAVLEPSQGLYKGTFQRSINSKISNVILKLTTAAFEGESQYLHYPDICSGNYFIAQDSISFSNGCVYTADFDWSYILSGKYKIEKSGDSLVMRREYNGFIYYYDVYRLKKQ